MKSISYEMQRQREATWKSNLISLKAINSRSNSNSIFNLKVFFWSWLVGNNGPIHPVPSQSIESVESGPEMINGLTGFKIVQNTANAFCARTTYGPSCSTGAKNPPLMSEGDFLPKMLPTGRCTTCSTTCWPPSASPTCSSLAATSSSPRSLLAGRMSSTLVIQTNLYNV